MTYHISSQKSSFVFGKTGFNFNASCLHPNTCVSIIDNYYRNNSSYEISEVPYFAENLTSLSAILL